MRRLLLILCLNLASVSGPLLAASFAEEVMTEQSFFQLLPQQSPLSEQFTTLVNSPPNPLRISQQEPIRVVFLLFGDVDGWQNRLMLRAFKKRMRELGVVYRLDTYVDRSGYGTDFIAHLPVIEMESDYIIATQFNASLRRLFERFLIQGQGKLILFDFATPIVHWLPRPPLMYVGFDQFKTVQMLASYLDRQLSSTARISALVLPESYLGQMRCDGFLDEMNRYGREVESIYIVADDVQQAAKRTETLLSNQETDFIFSCSQNIAAGVLQVLRKNEAYNRVQTNVWGAFSAQLVELKGHHIKANTLFYWDDLSIAIAEAIKLDLEGRNLPNLYMARSPLLPEDIDPESLGLMLQQAYHYSVKKWQ
ncbi:substrate-binding domain-containing protein [Marinomonas posidonica]|uniref:Autoinducer 2-binding periplasmic protein LuxP n=1 Tax=Marinomonas posidonica (strain CECT 7376 / NCIMB 14433 / IVIA-Po-181) TaxID=491952 RepID=F6CUJ5_MARPP|nr:substrate-binding domain-containing protein [Marinomonas posidonica]AEF56415.1 autoinducer 2-binding periplasmic protein LuxP [Marinomonas posidonica IVIA-Po-181]